MSDGNLQRLTSVRASLFRNVGFLVAILGVALFVATQRASDDLLETASERLIDRTLDRSEAKLQAFFQPIERTLDVARYSAGLGTISIGDSDSLEAFFLPILRANPEISGASVGNADGRAWTLLRFDDSWRVRRTHPKRWGSAIRYEEWPLRGDGERRTWTVENPEDGDRFDPRNRPWWKAALEGAGPLEPGAGAPPGIFWTEPYSFFTTKEPGISGSVFVHEPGRPLTLVAVDVRLRELSDFTASLELGTRGFAAVLSSADTLIGLPRDEALTGIADREQALLRTPAEAGLSILRDELDYLVVDRPATFTFESGDEPWWGGTRAFTLPVDRRFQIVMAIPERDLIGPMNELRIAVALASLLALGGALLIAFQLAKRFATPLIALASDIRKIRELSLEPGARIQSKLAEVEELAGAHDSMRRALDSFARYVPVDVVRELLTRGEAARIGGTRENLSVLFTDVEGFTGIAENMEPEDLTAHMSDYFAAMLEEIERHGTVDKLMGDGIMAFWGAPTRDPDHTRHAAEAVLACQERLALLNEAWIGQGQPALPTRFGLACGDAVVGNVGAPNRLAYTAVGDTINLASRLEGLNRLYGTRVLAAEPFPELAGDTFAWRHLDRVRVVGRTQAVEVFELLGRAEDISDEMQDRVARYAEALALYRERRFYEAARVLSQLTSRRRADPAIRRLRDLCNRLSRRPLPEEWEPVTILDRK